MQFRLKTKNQLNITGAVIYYVYILIGAAMIVTRSHPNLLRAVPIYGKYALYQQATNFVISGIILSATALPALLQNSKSWNYILSAAAVIVAINFITELFITFINTKDIKDAIAGFVGVALSLLVLLAIDKWGITRTT